MSTSERRIAANRANAQKSTGPTTEEGKAASRGNAMKHGLAAEVLAVAGEDQATIDAEGKAWVEEIAPKGQVAARLAERAFRAFVRLQRCDRSDDRALEARVRSADSDWQIRRAEEVREAIDRLDSSPSIAVARLRSTAEGCDWLRSAWEVLAFNLKSRTWNRDDYDRAVSLLGIEQVGHIELLRWNDAIVELRELRREIQKSGVGPDLPVARLADHFSPEYCTDVETVRKAGASAKAGLADFLSRQVAELSALADALRPASDESRAHAEARALFDDSPEGKLRRRYAAEAEREMHRNLKSAKAFAKAAATPTRTEPEEPATRPESIPTRNEPNEPPAASLPWCPPAPAFAPNPSTSLQADGDFSAQVSLPMRT